MTAGTNCSATNGAGHQCSWPEGHKRYGFVGIPESGSNVTTASKPTVPLHGYWNPQGFWEIWPVGKN